MGQQILKGLVIGFQMGPGVINDIIRQSKTFGNGERITLSRDTDQQPVGWLEIFHAELAAGILYTRSRQGKYL